MALECARSDFEIERVFLSENYAGDAPFDESLTVRVSEEVFRYLSDEKTPQGILCRVRIPKTTPCPPKASCLFLDGVADPGNVGAILRTANAAGYSEVYMTSDCADPYSPKSVRASMSGIFFTKIYQGEREALLKTIEATPVVVADMGGENVFGFIPPKRFALVIGNEANGVSAQVRNQAAHTVKIPMSATQESLNAAVSAGIIMYVLKKEEF